MYIITADPEPFKEMMKFLQADPATAAVMQAPALTQAARNGSMCVENRIPEDRSNLIAMSAIYGEFFNGKFPARSCVQVAKLPAGALFEIERIAAKP